MAQNTGLAYRGLILLGLMLILVTVVGFILFRPPDSPPPPPAVRPEAMALAVPQPGVAFPAQINWGALVMLSEQLPSSPGWQVRYNAAISLARRGSPKTPFDVLCQMLDEEQQMRNFRLPLKEGGDVADEYAARSTVIAALKAVEEWHKHADAVKAVGTSNPELQRSYAAIDKLTHSSNSVVREKAEEVRKMVGRGEQK